MKDFVFTVSFHDFDLILQQAGNIQYEQMMLIVFEKLHKFVEQATEQKKHSNRKIGIIIDFTSLVGTSTIAIGPVSRRTNGSIDCIR